MASITCISYRLATNPILHLPTLPQTLIMVHVWMLHRRLLLEGSKGTTLQECMFDELWDDTSIRIRNAGIQEIMVNKRLGEVQVRVMRVVALPYPTLPYPPHYY